MDKKSSDQKKLSLSVNLDTTPVLYTDHVIMTANQDGLVIDFTQRLGPTNQSRIVSRVGMSREHAKRLVEKMANILTKSEGQSETGSKIVVDYRDKGEKN